MAVPESLFAEGKDIQFTGYPSLGYGLATWPNSATFDVSGPILHAVSWKGKTMKPSVIFFTTLFGAIAVAAIVARVASSDAGMAREDSGMPTLVGAPAAMYFTDDRGNPRLPTAAERAQLAAAFQSDLAALTRNKRIPAGSKREPNGAVSAVVATRKLQYLVAGVDEDGNVTFGHAQADDDGKVDSRPVNKLPEM